MPEVDVVPASRASLTSTYRLQLHAGFTFAEIYTVRIEYQRVFDAGDENTDEADLDMAIIGVTVAF